MFTNLSLHQRCEDHSDRPGSYMNKKTDCYLQCTCKLYLFVSTSSKAISGLQKSPKSELQFYIQNLLTVPYHLAKAKERMKKRESTDATGRRENCIVELIKSQASHFLNTLSEQDCAKPVWSCQVYEAAFSNYTCVCLWFKKIF